MKQSYTKENLNQLGIFELREVARNIGVHLPTTYKKDELIEKIIQVANGFVDPFVPKTKKGRPPKSLISKKSTESLVESQVNSKKQYSWIKGSYVEAGSKDFFSELRVGMRDVAFHAKNPNSKQEEFGILFVEPDKTGALHIGGFENISESDIAYVPEDLIEIFQLKTGDKLKVLTFLNLDEQKVVEDIVEINDVDVKSFKRENCFGTNRQVLSSSDLLDFSGDSKLSLLNIVSPIGKGQRVFVHSNNSLANSRFFQTITKQSEKLNLKTIIIALDKRPEDKKLFTIESATVLFSNFDTTPFRQMYLTELGIERAKRLCESGEDVLLVVDGLLSVLRTYDCCLEHQKDFQPFGVDAVVAIKKLLAIGGNFEGAGTITLLAGIEEGFDPDFDKLINTLNPFANCHIYLKNIENQDFEILPTSVTENALDLISREDFEKGKNIRQEFLKNEKHS